MKDKTANWIWHNYIYDWICSNCGFCPDTDQPMNITPSLPECPKCKAKMLNSGYEYPIKK